MPKMVVSGLEGVQSALRSLEKGTEGILKMGVYDGMAIIADEVRRSTEQLPISGGRGTREHPLKKGVTKKQKEGLLQSIGISAIEKRGGVVQASVSFTGYNAVKTKRWPNGQPNILVARAAESGVSWKEKSPFMRPALNRAKKKAMQAAEKTITEAVNAAMKGEK